MLENFAYMHFCTPNLDATHDARAPPKGKTAHKESAAKLGSDISIDRQTVGSSAKSIGISGIALLRSWFHVFRLFGMFRLSPQVK